MVNLFMDDWREHKLSILQQLMSQANEISKIRQSLHDLRNEMSKIFLEIERQNMSSRKELREPINLLNEKIEELGQDMASMKTKASIFGAIGGALIGFFVQWIVKSLN